jgi:hypothetical protein
MAFGEEPPCLMQEVGIGSLQASPFSGILLLVRFVHSSAAGSW